MRRMLIILLISVIPSYLTSRNNPLFRSIYTDGNVHSERFELSSSDTIYLHNYGKVFSLSIDAIIYQPHESSSVCIVMEDRNGQDHLVAESDWFRNDSTVVNLSNYCEETAILDGVEPVCLKCFLSDARLMIRSISVVNEKPQFGKCNISPKELKRQQVEDIVGRINTYNTKHRKLWIAGPTSSAMKRYEEREYGKDVHDSYFNNIIYYADGIYEVGDRSLDSELGSSLYVDSFSWKNRHGKDWMTIPKNQQSSNWCVPFAIASAVEAMVNLYYNQSIDMDLSERDIAFNNNRQPYLSGTLYSFCMSALKNYGVMDEASFPFIADTNYVHPSSRPEWQELVTVNDYSSIYPQPRTGNDKYDNVKGSLIKRGPAVSGIYTPFHRHAMCLTGYGKVTPDVAYSILAPNITDTIIYDGHPDIGKTFWEFKDNYYEDPAPDIRKRYFGHEGYMYVIFHDNSDCSMASPYFITTPINTLSYSQSDIKVEDLDGDGYFNWGIGPKPDHCPAWIPDEPDGDDSNPDVGIMDDYGYLASISPSLMDTLYIDSDTSYNDNKHIVQNICIRNNSTLTISSVLLMNRIASITVRSGTTLLIDEGCIRNANIKAEPGSHVVLQNNGHILTHDSGQFNVPIGVELTITDGEIM